MSGNMKNIDYFKRSESEIFAELKQILDLHDYVVKTETTNKKTLIYKFFFKKHAIFSVKAQAWKKDNFIDFKHYTSTITIKNEELSKYTEKELKIILISDIYKQIIQNNIMMI